MNKKTLFFGMFTVFALTPLQVSVFFSRGRGRCLPVCSVGKWVTALAAEPMAAEGVGSKTTHLSGAWSKLRGCHTAVEKRVSHMHDEKAACRT